MPRYTVDVSREGKITLLLFALALVVRVAFFGANIAAHGNELLPTILNSEGYYELANNILAGRGFSERAEAPFVPDSLRPPLYPLFIAAFFGIFGTYWAVIIAQLFSGSLLPLLARRVSFRIIPRAFIANAVGAVFAVEPVLVRLSGVLLTETLFLALFFASIIALFNYLDRSKLFYLAASGLTLGLATLTRPVTQYLPFVVAAFLIWHFRRALSWRIAGHIALFVGVFAATLMPWLYRNYTVFGTPRVANTTVSNMYGYFAPSVLSLANNTSFDNARAALFAEDELSDYSAVTLEDAGRFTARAKDTIKTHPKETAKLVGITTFAFFTHDGYLDVLQDLGLMKTFSRNIRALITGPGILILAGRMFWTLAAVLALIGAMIYFKRNGLEPKTFFAALLIAYFAATAAIVGLGITGRYRLPATVFILTFAGHAATTIYSSLRNKRLPI